MPDWSDTLANRRNGGVAGFTGKDTPLTAADTSPAAEGTVIEADGKGGFELAPPGTYASLLNPPASVAAGEMFYGLGTTPVMQTAVTGDTQPRWQRDANGKQQLGGGGATPFDVDWYRMAAGIIGTDNNAQIAGRLGVGVAPSAGSGLRVSTLVDTDKGVTIQGFSPTQSGSLLVMRGSNGVNLGEYQVTDPGWKLYADATHFPLQTFLTSLDTQPTWKKRGDGWEFFGVGGSTSTSANFGLLAAAILGTNQSFEIDTRLGVGVAPSSGAAVRVSPIAADSGVLIRQTGTPTGNPLNVLAPAGAHIFTVDAAGRLNTFASAGNYALYQVLADGDANATIKVRADGAIMRGGGGGAATDLTEYRRAAGVWATDQSMRVGTSLGIGVDPDTDFTGNTGHMLRVTMSSADTYGEMIRSFSASQSNSHMDFQHYNGLKLANFVPGVLEGPGWRLYGLNSVSNQPAIAIAVDPPGSGGDELHRLRLYIDGRIMAGPGGAAGSGNDPDVTLRRGGAGFWAVPILSKAGVPSDADYANTPPNNVIAINTSGAAGSRLYQRLAGVWTAIA